MRINEFEIEKQYFGEEPFFENMQQLVESFPKEKQSAVESALRHIDNDKMVYTMKRAGLKIGEITLAGYSTATPEIGIGLIEEYRGKGVGFFILSQLLEKLRETHNYKYIKYYVLDGNQASVRLAEKLGGILVDRKDTVPNFNILKYHIPMNK